MAEKVEVKKVAGFTTSDQELVSKMHSVLKLHPVGVTGDPKVYTYGKGEAEIKALMDKSGKFKENTNGSR